MATTVKKKSSAKSPAKKKPALKKSKKVNPWLIGLGAVVVALVGAVVVRMSFASGFGDVYNKCGVTTLGQPSWKLVLTNGSRGSCVMVLQDGLKKTAFLGKNEKVDGIYGSKTGNSVLLAESFYGLKSPNKITEYCTWSALQGAIKYGRSDVGSVRKHVANQAGKRCLN